MASPEDPPGEAKQLNWPHSVMYSPPSVWKKHARNICWISIGDISPTLPLLFHGRVSSTVHWEGQCHTLSSGSRPWELLKLILKLFIFIFGSSHSWASWQVLASAGSSVFLPAVVAFPKHCRRALWSQLSYALPCCQRLGLSFCCTPTLGINLAVNQDKENL